MKSSPIFLVACLFLFYFLYKRMSKAKTFEKGVAAPKTQLNGSGLRIAIVHTRWNYALVDQLYNKVYETLVKKYNVLPENITTVNTYCYSIHSLTSRIGYCLWCL